MDFRRLAKALPASNLPANASEPLALTDLPPNLLEALIPGYGIISRYINAILGVDITLFVTAGLLCFGLFKAGQILYRRAEDLFRSLFVSTVNIDEHDDLFDMVMIWLSAQQTRVSKRSVRAKTQHGSRVEELLSEGDGSEALDENGLFDYNKWSARTPPRFEPYYGKSMFWYNDRLFFFRRQVKPSQGQRVQVSFNRQDDDDVLQLECIGRSTEPIRDLLRSIKIWSLTELRNMTTIRHPTPKDRARFGGSWSKTSSRPSRPIDTVILDAEQKSGIINDMNEYLHPSSPRWYATRGIPYRRGYLFHGPPGTGKTSLSFALAGIFGLEIYAISLQEPTLTEGDLMQLFNSLPRRCVVLLEDVDAAGLIRDGQSGKDEKSKRDKKDEKKKDEEKKDESKPKKDEEYSLKDLARELKSLSSSNNSSDAKPIRKRPNQNENNNQTGISLSGLLNAIDGVATHEGRVLIMTTNHPEKLDAALVRPGRVDRRVAFALATKEQIRELFVRMYAASDQVTATVKKNFGGPNNGHAVNGTDENELKTMSANELEALAVEFSGAVPSETYTPAEIQNHLMRYKKAPRKAVEKAEAWVREMEEEKEKAKEGEDEDDET